MVVVGDDDFAAERVVQLSGYATKVMMITRKKALTVTPTVKGYLDELKNVQIITGQAVTEIVGDGTKVIGVRLRDLALGTEKNLSASTVYLNSVYKPDSVLVKGQLELDPEGYIVRKDGSQETLVPGIFAAGAVSNKPNKAGPCAGYGMATGVEVIEFMHKKVGFNPETSKALEKFYYQQEQTRSLGTISQVTTTKQLKKIFKEKPITVLFAFSPGCPFCKAMYPDVVEVTQELQDKVALIILNANELGELRDSLTFDSVPTTFIYKDGQLVHTIKGRTNKLALSNVLKNIISQETAPKS